MTAPTLPPVISATCAMNTMNTTTSEPTRFPSQTIPQFLSMPPSLMRRLLSAVTMSALPVNSSAPQQSISTRPTQKQTPPTTR